MSEAFKMTVAVDMVLFGYQTGTNSLRVLLIRRSTSPHKGALALPGGRVDLAESTDAAAIRELAEETGIRPAYLEQLYTFSEPNRDPRGRVISVAYFGLLNATHFTPQAGSDASEAEWVEINQALTENLAFDHNAILRKALERIRGKVRYSPIGFDLLPRKFRMSELRQLYETILERKLDAANFRKKVLSLGILVETGETVPGQHRPAQLFKFDTRAYNLARKNRFNFEI